MNLFGSLAFLSPWLLLGLLALPVLWWLLRAVPPAPNRVAFPGVRILLGLEDPEKTPDKTPWWLLLLRVLAVAAAIVAAYFGSDLMHTLRNETLTRIFGIVLIVFGVQMLFRKTV